MVACEGIKKERKRVTLVEFMSLRTTRRRNLERKKEEIY